MKRKIALILALLLLVSLCLTGCGGQEIKLSKDGLATWKPVKNAVEYVYMYVDEDYVNYGEKFTTDCSVYVPNGYSVHVRARLSNGEYSRWMTSDYFYGKGGEMISEIEKAEVFGGSIDPEFDISRDSLETYEVIGNIDYSSLKELADGSVYFEAAGPGGDVMRFQGRGITVSEGSISIEPGGRLTSLDAIGRIYALTPTISEPGAPGNFVDASGGYTFTQATSVESMDELYFIYGFGVGSADSFTEISLMKYQPNFISVEGHSGNEDAYSISALTVHYDESTYNTGIRTMGLSTDFYGSYMEGDYYDPSKEVYDSANCIFTFYLLVMPDVIGEIEPYYPDPVVDDLLSRSISDIPMDSYEIGDVKNAAGEVLDKNNAKLDVGSTLEIKIGDYCFDMTLPVLNYYEGAQNLHELTPYANGFAEGEVTAFVVPVSWSDQPENATDELMEQIYAELGRVEDAQGNVTDWSAGRERGYSLSEYYDTVSYGKYKINSFVTDWFPSQQEFTDMMEEVSAGYNILDHGFEDWLQENYPNLDKSRFDRNGDGFFDSVIIINAGRDDDGEMVMASYSHAVRWSPGYTGENAGTQSDPVIKDYISMNMSFLGGNTLIHEYGHNFGLIDYYDVTYSGIDAVGSFDMQSISVGDWNSYSKYAVGWIEPQIVQGLQPGESVELKIGSSATTGDAIVIPAAGAEHEGPFSEYILVDLFSDEGVNSADAADYGLAGVQGVRIYHVNAAMEKRVLHRDGVAYPIGTVHYANAYNEKGQYHLELIQAGGVNTFTDLNNLRIFLCADDLFTAGDSFSLDSHSAFFNEGLMDDGSDFGYRIEVVSIEQGADGAPIATIRVTR